MYNAINSSKYSDYINELVLYFDFDLKKRNSLAIQFFNYALTLLFFVVPTFFAFLLYALVLLAINRRWTYKVDFGNDVCVSRTFATSSKLNFIRNSHVIFFEERPLDTRHKSNIYALNILDRTKVTINSFFVFYSDIKGLSYEISNYLSPLNLVRSVRFYLARLPHKVMFQSYLECLIESSSPRRLITGNKEDRYALAEQKLCKRLGVLLICYPHGLEYAMILPRGVVGDIFYCLSPTTQVHYSSIYKEGGQEFRFSQKVVESMLGRSSAVKSGNKHVVFFPESRGIDVNQRIVEQLVKHNIKFYLKLHPSDSIENYLEFGVTDTQVLKDFDTAVSGQFVLARKSTVLLEAIYSGSSACAVLTDKEDRFFFENQFPSLWDSRIDRVYSFEDLIGWVNSTIG